MKAAQILDNLGQSIWLGSTTRDLLDTGTLKRYIDEISVKGLTSNSTIFENPTKNRPSYDVPIREKLSSGRSAEELFFELALEAHTRVADLFRPIYDRTKLRGRLGFNEGVATPSLRGKRHASRCEGALVPGQAPESGTKEGFPAIEESIVGGVPVNVSPVISREH
jgi:transaldolase